MRDRRIFRSRAVLGIALATLSYSALGSVPANQPLEAAAPLSPPSTPDSAREISKLQFEIELASLRTEAKLESEAKERALIAHQASNLENRIDHQDRAIDRQDRTIDRAISTFGIILSVATLVAALLGFVGFVTVRSRATEEARAVARSEAKETSDQWFKENAGNVSATLSRLSKELDETKDKAERIFSARAAEIETLAQQARTAIQNQLASDTPPTPISNVESLALAESAHAAEAKPASLRRFEDWNTSAFEAIRNNDVAAATAAWIEASKAQDASEASRAGALFNAALAHQKFQNDEASLKIADKLIEEFGSTKDPSTQVQVARARVTKASSLRRLGREDESIRENLDVADGFDPQSHPEMLERIVNARTNAIIALAGKGDLKSIIAQISKLQESTKICDLPFARRAVAKTQCCLSSALLGEEKWNECIESCKEAERIFENDDDPEVKSWVTAAAAIKSVGLYAIGDAAGAIENLNSTFINLKDNCSEDAAHTIVIACANLARLMTDAESYSAALTLYSEILSITHDSPNDAVNNMRPAILTNRSHSLIRAAKAEWANPDTRDTHLAEAKDNLEDSLNITPHSGTAQANLAYVNYLMTEECDTTIAILRAAFLIEGPELVASMREDALYNRTAADSAFLDMIDAAAKSEKAQIIP